MQLKNVILIGDRILVAPESRDEQKTRTGIIIPQSAVDDDSTSSGIVVAVGPGTLAGKDGNSSNEAWMENATVVGDYIPLQIKVGYRVLYMPEYSREVKVADGKTYMLMSQSAVIFGDKDPYGLEEDLKDVNL